MKKKSSSLSVFSTPYKMGTRREFVKNIVAIAGAGTAVSLLGACKPYAFVAATADGKKIIVKKSAFGEKPFVVIQSDMHPASIYLRRIKDDEFVALLMECTHKQCGLRPYVNLLQCPCHGSEFSYMGEVLEPPATQPLKRFTVTTDDQNIFIE